MSSTVTHISCEKVAGINTFLVRQYNTTDNIGETPIDIWESFELICDKETLDYLVATQEDEGVRHLTNMIRIVDAYSHYMTADEKAMMEQADKFLYKEENKPEMIFSSYR